MKTKDMEQKAEPASANDERAKVKRMVLRQIRNINNLMLEHARWQGPEEYQACKARIAIWRNDFLAKNPGVKI